MQSLAELACSEPFLYTLDYRIGSPCDKKTSKI